ncbi:MAG TPA: PEGA domain-containing protein [Tepidisphaeraceae bacterium]
MNASDRPPSSILHPPPSFFLASLALLLPGCVEQTMEIKSDPPNALVYLNDQEVGRTPVTRDFKWYGDYDVQLRLEGHEALKTHQKVIAPAWNWVPFDLFANLLPFTFKDHRSYSYTLTPLDPAKDHPQGLLDRAEYLKDKLESGPFTRVATPRRTTTTRSTAPATRPG